MAGLHAVLGGQRVLDLGDLDDQPLRDIAYLPRDLRVGIDRSLLREDFLVGLQPQRLFILRRDALVDEHFFASQRIGAAIGEIVVGAIHHERHEDQDSRAEAGTATPAALGLCAVTERVLTHLCSP